jgi:hypothetical protein
MFKSPFVRHVQVWREVLEEELQRLRELPYSLWRDVVACPMYKTTRGRDDRTYRVRITPAWAHNGSEDIRVTVALETRALHRPLMRQSFVITPENRFTE